MNENLFKRNEGSNPSFEQIFSKYQSHLVFFARKLIRDQLVAEDIVTEVFIKYWNKRNNFANAIAVKAFLEVSTKNACLNHLKQVQYHNKQKKILLDSSVDHEDFILNEIIRTELITEIWDIIESLPVECRRIILLGHVKGISNIKIAQVLKLSPHTVRNQKFIGLQLIKKRHKELSKNRESNGCAA